MLTDFVPIFMQVSPVIHFISAVLPVENKINGERRESTCCNTMIKGALFVWDVPPKSSDSGFLPALEQGCYPLQFVSIPRIIDIIIFDCIGVHAGLNLDVLLPILSCPLMSV